MVMPVFQVEKPSTDIDDYVLDCSLWVGTGTLSNVEVVSATDVTVVSSTINAVALTVTSGTISRTIAASKAVQIRLSSGTAGVSGRALFRLTALDGRRRDVTIKVVTT